MKLGEYRTHSWLDMRNLKIFFGIQYNDKRRGWMHCHDRSKPLFFELEYDACGYVLALNDK